MKWREFKDFFPIGTEEMQLQFVTQERYWDNDEADIDLTYITFRLVFWDTAPDEWTGKMTRVVSNIKEQELNLVRWHGEDPRVDDMVLGWIAAVDTVMRKGNLNEAALPKDLEPQGRGSHPLELKRATTADDFEKAILAPARLGRYMKKP